MIIIIINCDLICDVISARKISNVNDSHGQDSAAQQQPVCGHCNILPLRRLAFITKTKPTLSAEQSSLPQDLHVGNLRLIF